MTGVWHKVAELSVSLVEELETLDVPTSALPDADHGEAVHNLQMKAIYDKEPKRRVGPFDDGEVVVANGVPYIIRPDVEVMVPESIWAILENKKKGERYVKGINDALKKRAQAGPSAAVHYIR